MKKILKIIGCFLIIIGCSDDNNLLEDIAARGGYVQFVETPNLNFNILTLDSETIMAQLVDPNNNATNYSLSAIFNGNVVHDVVQINSFPATLELQLSNIFSALGIAEDDINLSSKITLVATITTPTGIYTGLSPNYDNNNVNQGGNTTTRLKAGLLNDAVEFDITFFLPPAKTIRRTSFEQVSIGAATAVYTRNGGADVTGDIINGVNPPFVDFTALGNSVTDEIGFNSEYVAVPGISASSLGFTAERIGVFSLSEFFTTYPDGNQGYHMEDVDGMIRITFDTVDVPAGQNRSGISFKAFYGDTSWESKDGIIAYVNITTDTGNDVIELVNIFDNDVEAVAGVWNEYNTGFLKNIRSYQLVIEGYNGATAESIDIDDIIIFEPES